MMRSARVLVFPAALVLAAPAAADDLREVRKTVDLAANGRVSVETFKGSIDVSTWDRPQAEIVARIEPDDSDTARAQREKIRETEIRIEGSGSGVRIKSDYSRVRWHHLFGFPGSGTLPYVHYTIRMPRTAALEIKDHKSKSRIAGLAAPLQVDTHKGGVEIRGMDGPVRLHTYKGEVHATYARYAKSEFETHKGSIEIALPKQTGFSLEMDLGHRGDLDSDFGGIARATRSSHRWRHDDRVQGTAINGGGPTLKLTTYKGEFRLRGI